VAFDSAGNVVVATSAPQVLPVVTSTTPTDGASVQSDTQVSAVFSQAMDEPSTAGAFSLQDDTTGQAVPGSVTWLNPTEARFAPTGGSLTVGDQYTATISTAATDAAGVPLASPVTWSFTIAPPPVPVVTSTDPANGATGVSPGKVVSTVFSEPMNESTTSGAFSLQDDTTGQAVPISVYVSEQDAAFSPTGGPLTMGDQYTATVSTAATDAAGVPLASPFSWTFTILSLPCQKLAGCNLSGLDLSGLNFAGADLHGANLHGANLEATNLHGADLAGANLMGANLTLTILSGANVQGANFGGVTWFLTTCPDGTNTFNNPGGTCTGHL
jgi:hypothetical protein